MIASFVPLGTKLFFDWLITIMLAYATNAYYTEHSRVDSSPDFILSPIKISKAFFKLQKAGKRLAATQAIIVHGSHLTLVDLGISSNSQTRFWGVL